ncbi:hypothetical protein PG984_016110 [Apiospora sp. TS-2023a]
MTLRSSITAMPAPTLTLPPTISTSSSPWSTPSNWDHKTRVYLDEVPAYWQLPACALTPISTIVRDMSKGCGDGGRLTSYACFCTESYRKARWDISTEIAAKCSSGGDSARMMARTVDAGPTTTTAVTIATLAGAVAAAATTGSGGSGGSGTESASPRDAVGSALGVFEAYCSIGIGHGIYEPSQKAGSGESTSVSSTLLQHLPTWTASRRASEG